MLAQLPAASESQVLSVLLGGAALLAIGVMLLSGIEKTMNLFRRNRSIAVHPAPTCTLDELKVKVESLDTSFQHLDRKVDEGFADMHTKRERSWDALHEKIN